MGTLVGLYKPFDLSLQNLIKYRNIKTWEQILLELNCLGRHPSLRERTRPQLLY